MSKFIFEALILDKESNKYIIKKKELESHQISEAIDWAGNLGVPFRNEVILILPNGNFLRFQ